MTYKLKSDQLLQTGIQQFQMLSSKMSQSTIGQLAGRAITQIRKNILNEYLQNNLGLAPRVILIANLGAAIFSGIITRHLELKAKKTDQSPQVKANQGIKIFTVTTLVINTGLYLVTNFPADSSWIIGFTLAQTIAATAYFKNKELKEHKQAKEQLQDELSSKDKTLKSTENAIREANKTDNFSNDLKKIKDALQISEQTCAKSEKALEATNQEMVQLKQQYQSYIDNQNNQVIAKSAEIDKLKQKIEELSTKVSKHPASEINKLKKNPTTQPKKTITQKTEIDKLAEQLTSIHLTK